MMALLMFIENSNRSRLEENHVAMLPVEEASALGRLVVALLYSKKITRIK